MDGGILCAGRQPILCQGPARTGGRSPGHMLACHGAPAIKVTKSKHKVLNSITSCLYGWPVLNSVLPAPARIVCWHTFHLAITQGRRRVGPKIIIAEVQVARHNHESASSASPCLVIASSHIVSSLRSTSSQS